LSASSKRSRGGSALEPELVLLWGAIVLVATVLGLVWAASHLAGDGVPAGAALPGNPFELVRGLIDGSIDWTRATTVALVAMLVSTAAVAAGAFAGVKRWRGRATRSDRAASKMGRGRDLGALSRRGAGETAKRLGVDSPGLPIARTVAGNQLLYAGWEDVSVDIWGPRTGKSTSRAIPAILSAPGAVVATSNKRDLVDATRDIRRADGEVWVFDPQGIVDEPVSWWWDPLSFVTDEVRASILADVFASASRDVTARSDAYFEPAGQDLLANLLYAAALARRPIGQVYLWLTDPSDDEPVEILREHEAPLLAAALQAVVSAPEKQRGGVFGTAQQMASFMTNSQAMRWVTPPPDGEQRRQLEPREFVHGQDTLYSLSKEGRGSAGPLVTALTVAVTDAAEEHAKGCPQGRLAVPMVVVADEAANCVKWRELPNVYSHYGSRGICVMTILQSWSQGVEVWGREGMRKLWSAANVKVYGGGVAEVEFLQELSQLIGDFDLDTIAVSHGRGGRSVNHSTRRERVMEVAELGALPRGRAIVFASGAPATLVRTLPWMEGPQAKEVRASIRAHDPAAEKTIAAAQPAATAEGATA